MTKLYNIGEPGVSGRKQDGIATKVENAVGIDLGTTNSLIAIVKNGKPEIITDVEGRSILPSVVCYEPDGVTVGYDAVGARHAGIVIHSVKRLMGRRQQDIQAMQAHLAYALVATDDGIEVKTAAGNKSPIQVSAAILQNLKQRAENYLGSKVEHAVITVPAHFDEAARLATKQAAKLAGLNVLRIINEPTAAAFAYGLERNAKGTYLVFDLGGGTCDISIIRMTKGLFHVLATAGDTRLGGDDFDNAIADRLNALAEFSRDAEAVARNIKEHLSSHDNWRGNGVLFSREELDKLMEPYLKRMRKLIQQALADAHLAVGDIDAVLLVGGSTKMPCIRQMVETYFGKMPLTSVNPEEVVAVGAALQAHQLCYGGSTTLLDVVPLSIGIELGGGIVEVVIPRNTPIPTEVVQRYTTMRDWQTAFAINVLQGEGVTAAECISLARFELHLPQPLPAGKIQLEVRFRVDADGLLAIEAQVLPDGARHEILVKPGG